ncbi:hypothetical protein QOT17_010348 [Balamuthia mandrillaris]
MNFRKLHSMSFVPYDIYNEASRMATTSSSITQLLVSASMAFFLSTILYSTGGEGSNFGCPCFSTFLKSINPDGTVGHLFVRNDKDFLYITFRAVDFWKLAKINLHVGRQLSDIPTMRYGSGNVYEGGNAQDGGYDGGNVKYGRDVYDGGADNIYYRGRRSGGFHTPDLSSFDHKAELDNVRTYTAKIKLDKLNVYCDQSLVIAAHAAVVRTKGGYVVQSEDVWGAGPKFRYGSDASYLTYFLCCPPGLYDEGGDVYDDGRYDGGEVNDGGYDGDDFFDVRYDGGNTYVQRGDIHY